MVKGEGFSLSSLARSAGTESSPWLSHSSSLSPFPFRGFRSAPGVPAVDHYI